MTIAPTGIDPFPAVFGVPTMSLTNLTVDSSQLDTGGTLSVTGNFSWTNSSSSGTSAIQVPITVGGASTLGGTDDKELFDTLTLNGPTTISGAPLTLANASQLVNNSTLTMAAGSQIGNGGGGATHTVTNNGVLAVPSGTAKLALYDAAFNDPGQVTVSHGAVLEVVDGQNALSSSSTFGGGGSVTFGSSGYGMDTTLAPNVTITKPTSVKFVGPNSTFFDGTGSFIGNGVFDWTGGAITGNLTIGGSVSSDISGKNAKVIQGGTLTLSTKTKLSGTAPVELADGSTLTNTGSMTMAKKSSVTFGGGGATDFFTNSGSLIVSAGHANASITGVNFTNTGTVQAKSGTLLTKRGERTLPAGRRTRR